MTSLDPNINCYRPILQSDAACASHEAAEGAQRSLASGNAPNGPRTLSQSQSNSSEGDAQDEEFRMLVHAYLHDMDCTSSNLAVLNLVHSITNAGLVALPYAASCAGIPLFTLTVLVIAVVSGYSAIVMIG